MLEGRSEMDLNNREMEAKLLAGKVKRRQELLRIAKGHRGCWTGFEIALFICGILMIIFIILRTKDVYTLLLVTVMVTLTGFESSRTGRRIDALIELMGEDELLK